MDGCKKKYLYLYKYIYIYNIILIGKKIKRKKKKSVDVNLVMGLLIIRGLIKQYVRLVADQLRRRRDPGHGTVVEEVPVAGGRVLAQRGVVAGYRRARVIGHRVQVVLGVRLYAAGRARHVRAHVQRHGRERHQRRDLLVRLRALETFQVQHQVPGQLLEAVRLVHFSVHLARAAPGPLAVVQHLLLREVLQQVGDGHDVGGTAARRQRQRQVPEHLRRKR